MRFGRVAQFRQRLAPREVHRQLIAHIGKAGMHFGSVGTRFGARKGIVWPKLCIGMTLGQRFADRQTVPHRHAAAVLFDLEDRHAPCSGKFGDLVAGERLLAQRHEHFLELGACRTQRHIGTQAPARPILGADDQGIGHVFSLASRRD